MKNTRVTIKGNPKNHLTAIQYANKDYQSPLRQPIDFDNPPEVNKKIVKSSVHM